MITIRMKSKKLLFIGTSNTNNMILVGILFDYSKMGDKEEYI